MRDYLDLFKKIFFLTGNNVSKLIFLNFYFIISAVIDVVSIGIIIPYLGVITNPDFFKEIKFLGYEFNFTFLYYETSNLILFLSVLVLCVFLIKTITLIWINREISKFCYRIGGELRYVLLNNYFNTNYINKKKSNSADYIYKIQSLSMIYAKGSLLPFMRMISDLIVLFFIILVILLVNFYSAVFIFLLLFIFSFFYLRFFKNIIISYGKKINSYNNSIIRTINESIRGYREIKIYDKENYFLDFIDKLSKKYTFINVNNITITKSFRYLVELFAVLIMILIILFFSYSKINLINYIPLFTFYGFALLRMMPSVNNIIVSLNQIRLNKDSIYLLHNDLKNMPFIDYNEIKVKNSSYNFSDNKEVDFDQINFENISFSYDQNQNLINNFSLKIKKGECIGLFGSSGSGKTTLIEMLLGFIEPLNGKINVLIKNKLEKISYIKKEISYVPQEIFILDSSLYTNITLQNASKTKNSKDDNFYVNALKKSYINSEFIKRFEFENNKIGEQGSLISGGQRQRIAIARLLYQNKKILIFDEATTNLDKKTQDFIMQEIYNLKGSKTIIIISHDKNILNMCDKVINLNS